MQAQGHASSKPERRTDGRGEQQRPQDCTFPFQRVLWKTAPLSEHYCTELAEGTPADLKAVMCELTPSCAMGSHRTKNQEYEDINVKINLNELPHKVFSLKKTDYDSPT